MRKRKKMMALGGAILLLLLGCLIWQVGLRRSEIKKAQERLDTETSIDTTLAEEDNEQDDVTISEEDRAAEAGEENLSSTQTVSTETGTQTGNSGAGSQDGSGETQTTPAEEDTTSGEQTVIELPIVQIQ